MDDSGKSGAKGAALLLVIGEPFSEENKNLILAEITKGFRCWDVEETGIDINDELAQIANRADLGEEGPCVSPYGHQLKEGERIIRHQSEKVAVEILVNPQTTSVTNGVKNFLSSPTQYKHMIYAGHAFQGSGAWILQDDTYTFSNFSNAFKDEVVADTLKQDTSLVIYTASEGDWTNGHITKSDFSKKINVKLNPSDKLEAIHGVLQFSAYVSNFVRVRHLNELLKSSDVVGNIKFSRPTMYIFPACQGDSALFGINGFNLLVNGGYSRKACFWDFTRHLDRIDAALMTHLGTDNLYGFSTVLQRKSIENVHPEIGFMYVNATDKIKTPTENDDKKESLHVNLAEEGHKLIQYARQIGPSPQPVSRSHSGQSIEPITLYQKVGIGSLDMYILNPVTDSKELKDFYQQWNQNVAQFGSNWHMPLPNTLSVCALLVWKPSDPNDNITRVFFPGNAPQHKVLEGLEKLKNMDFLKHVQCTRTTLSTKPAAKKQAAIAAKPAPKPKSSPVTTPRNESPKKEFKEPVIPKSSTPKAKAAPPLQKVKKEKEDVKKEKEDIKKEKEDVNKKAMKAPEKAKTEKADKPKKTTSQTKAPGKSSSPKKESSAKAPGKKPESATAVPDLIDTAPSTEEPVLNGSHGSSVDPPGFSSEPLEPTPASHDEDPESLTDHSPSSAPEPSAEAEEESHGSGAMDNQRMLDLGIYEDDQDIEQHLAQQVEESPENESPEDEVHGQMYGGMADSMHQDLMDDLNERNAMQGSYHADLMTGSMHEAMFDNNQPFDGQGYYPNGGSNVDDLMTPEDEKSEEIQPQALPEPVPYAPESYGQEPDIIPTMMAKEEPQIIDNSETTPTYQEPDLLMGKQDARDDTNLDEESTVPVDEKHGIQTPDEVESTFPEDVEEKDLNEKTEKESTETEFDTKYEPEDEIKAEEQPQQHAFKQDQFAEENEKDEDSVETKEFLELEKNGEEAVEEEDERTEEYQSKEDFRTLEQREVEEVDNLGYEAGVHDEIERPLSPEPDLLEQEEQMKDNLVPDSLQPEAEEEVGLEAEVEGDLAANQEEIPVTELAEQEEIVETDARHEYSESQDFEGETEFPVTETIEKEKSSFEEAEARQASPEIQYSDEERADSPDSQLGGPDSNKDALEKDGLQEPRPDNTYDYGQDDSIEREVEEQSSSPTEEVERDSIERDTEEERGDFEREAEERDSIERDLGERDSMERGIEERNSMERETEERDSAERDFDGPQSDERDFGEPYSADKDYDYSTQKDSKERSYSPEEPEQIEEGREHSEDQDARGSEERSVSPDESGQRQSADKSYEDESDETEETEDEESSSFDQEEATDEKCLIQNSASEHQRNDGKPFETHSDSLAEQPSDNLMTPESECTDASHGGQMGYHEIDEQDGDSIEYLNEKDAFAGRQGQQAHPFGEGFEQFGSTGYSAEPMGNPFEQQQTNPFAGYGQRFEHEASPDDENVRPVGGPAGFNPLADWGEPMGLPSPAPPEEKAATGTNQKGVPKTKPPSAKKAAEKAPASNDTKKPEPKKSAAPATKRPTSAPKPAASNGVPEKIKSKPPTGASNTSLNSSKLSTTGGALNASRLSTGGKAAPKPRPATAPATATANVTISENKPQKNGTKKPATATGSRSSPAVSKLPPLPAFTPFYVDLTYIPNHGNSAYCDVEFFKRVRARYYVLSALVPNTDTLDALFEGKKTWEDKSITTTIIPTYDHEKLRRWMAINSDQLAEHKIEVAPSASRCSIQLQDHETSSLAYRLEF